MKDSFDGQVRCSWAWKKKKTDNCKTFKKSTPGVRNNEQKIPENTGGVHSATGKVVIEKCALIVFWF